MPLVERICTRKVLKLAARLMKYLSLAFDELARESQKDDDNDERRAMPELGPIHPTESPTRPKEATRSSSPLLRIGHLRVERCDSIAEFFGRDSSRSDEDNSGGGAKAA